MFQQDDLIEFMGDPDFVPKTMGFALPENGDALTIVCLPSFDPEEIWSITPHGKVDIAIAKLQIWGSIPKPSQPFGTSDPSLKGQIVLPPDCVLKHSLTGRSSLYDQGLIGLNEYKDPPLDGVTCDGVSFIFTTLASGVPARRWVFNPSPSPLRTFLSGLAKEIFRSSRASRVHQYLDKTKPWWMPW